MKKQKLIRILTLVLAATMLCAACTSGENMYKHRRSDCDCPTF